MRDIVLNHLQQKNFDEIIKVLKNNKTFNSLLDDEIFKQIFFQYFTTELLSQEDLDITYTVFLYQCHKSNEYAFEFGNEDEEKVLRFLIEKTRDYNFAIKLPDYKTSIEIINEYKLKMKVKSEQSERLAKKHRDFEIVEKFSDNTEHLVKSIFNSPQEKEFYLACRDVFKSQLTLPNVSLTNLFNQNVVKKKFQNYFEFYLKSSIDFVIVDPETFIPILFFELDSKSYHTGEKAESRDKIKNLLVTELGNTLIRVTKRTGLESVNEYKDFLKVIKEEKNIT